ncbi:hypothetical protein ACT6QH_14250 [Xanthobacter sp. TB0139]|uniref:hypothetical protein n=1 Tax=Xanthobacter sp. TB0139 TaxID=3459178 RepID=UPI0040390637
MSQKQTAATASGVEALITRLRDEGVCAGRTEADRLVAEAQAHAREILEKAEAQAHALREAARDEAEALRRAGEDALRIAVRDTMLELKSQISQRFASEVGKTVSQVMRDDELLKRMVLAVASASRDEAGMDRAGEMVIELPRQVVGLDELRRNPEELVEGSLTHFAAATAADMLRAGVTFSRQEGDDGGIRIHLVDRGVSVELTDKAVAALLVAHLQPRFRALLEGVVR